MKKKILALILLGILLISASFPAFAQSHRTTEGFKLYVKVRSDYDEFNPTTLWFNLFHSSGKWLSIQSCVVNKPGVIEIDFPIGEYEIGTVFKLVAMSGLDSYSYYGKTYNKNEECLIGTYAQRDENGELIICNSGYITTTPLAATGDFVKEGFVNKLSIQSDTPYLIWVSKANFTVNLFKKQDGKWNLTNEFPCSIGAPSTPTVTGQYKYHQYQDKWQYSGYYVGPIMRFYRGYALHSTLVNNNGTDRDGRVGEMISHGCVRMKPADIRWLADNVPINTTVYVTNE